MGKTPLLSICIPSYNRPFELIRLLESIDINQASKLEVIICEDFSPSRELIRRKVSLFKNKSPLKIKYFENSTNLGYDNNLKELISKASAHFIIFMGDDDVFETKNFPKYLNFLEKNIDLGYILRRYALKSKGKIIEDFRYFKNSKFFDPGQKSFQIMLRRSVFISGFCFKRKLILKIYQTKRFAGTLLYQLFICGELTLNYKSAYCDILISSMDEDLRGIPEFGSSESEKKIYTPGKITPENSINFIKSFLQITKYFDEKYKMDTTTPFLNSFSKYSYPLLSIQRDKGIKVFIKYVENLRSQVHIDSTLYFKVYYFSLIIFGRKFCDFVIRQIKNILGYTPDL